METKKISLYHPDGLGDSYDSGVPIELFEAFSRLKEELDNKSEGIYMCTPIVFDPNVPGVTTCILEKRDGVTRKSEYVITLTKR